MQQMRGRPRRAHTAAQLHACMAALTNGAGFSRGQRARLDAIVALGAPPGQDAPRAPCAQGAARQRAQGAAWALLMQCVMAARARVARPPSTLPHPPSPAWRCSSHRHAPGQACGLAHGWRVGARRARRAMVFACGAGGGAGAQPAVPGGLRRHSAAPGRPGPHQPGFGTGQRGMGWPPWSLGWGRRSQGGCDRAGARGELPRGWDMHGGRWRLGHPMRVQPLSRLHNSTHAISQL